MGETVSGTAGLVPAVCWRRTLVDWSFQEWFAPDYSEGEYSIGYYRPDHVAGWPRVRVAGTEMAVYPEMFEMMRGLHLVLKGATEGEPLSGRVVGRRY